MAAPLICAQWMLSGGWSLSFTYHRHRVYWIQ